jgi:hypothetical protein
MKVILAVVLLGLLIQGTVAVRVSARQPEGDAAAVSSSAAADAGAAAAAAAGLSASSASAAPAESASAGSGSAAAPDAGASSALSSATSAVSDPLNLGSGVSQASDVSKSVTLPPFESVNSDVVAPNLGTSNSQGLDLDLDRRIKQTEDLLNRMVWQLNRETAWANSVHDIIQNYQYKYTKVLANIKKHSAATAKMRELASTLKKARLHEILEQDLAKATKELQELAASSSETSEDAGSYAALKERVQLMKNDLDKMSHTKVNKVLHGVQEAIKKAAEEAVPPPSADTLKDLMK